jgi:transposase InsO family protein
MSKLDLRRLMGGKHLTYPCTVTFNGRGVSLKSLLDTGANGFTFIDAALAADIAKHTGARARKLPWHVPVKGYNGSFGKAITHYIRLHLTVDGRKQMNVPFLILDLGQHEMILGRRWMECCKIQVDLAKRRLVWPADYGPTTKVITSQDQVVPRATIVPVLRVPDPTHQQDADRRDHAMAMDEERRKNGSNHAVNMTILTPERAVHSQISPEPKLFESKLPNTKFPPSKLPEPKLPEASGEDKEQTSPPSFGPPSCLPATPVSAPAMSPVSSFKGPKRTHNLDLQDRMRVMNDELSGKVKIKHTPYQKKEYREPVELPATLEIHEISAAAFNLHLKRADNTFFTTSLYEIDRILEERKTIAVVVEDEVSSQVPDCYSDFYDVFSKAESDKLPPHRSYDHKIVLEEERDLGFGPLYKMTTEELEVTKQYLVDNLDKGFIAPSQAPFAAPVLFVKKPNGGLRFCIDFRKLNAITRKDRYPLPLIDETLARISNAKIYTKLDIRQAFHRIRMDPASEELTTFRTRYGSYKCKVLPFGLTNGPATYQRYMNDILFDYLDDFCTAYLDDILIYSENVAEHEAQVKKVLQRLRDAGLQADVKKCEFGVTRTKYLGFIVSTDGIEVDPEKVSVVQNWLPPQSVKGVQSFLGFCNFYRRFIRDHGRIAKPLTHLTKNGVPFNFDRNCHEAFEELKARLMDAPLLQHYNYELESMIETDASDGVIAGILSQKHGEHWLPVAYFSKTMAPAECNYEIHDKEMLAIVKSLKEWRAELEGSAHRIRIYTDHKALEYFMTSKQLTARQARWAEALAEYHFLIAYQSGKANSKADALTRRGHEVEAQNAVKKENRTRTFLRQDQLDPRIFQELRSAPDNTVASIDAELFIDSTTIVDRILRANRESESLAALRTQAARPEETEFQLRDGLLLYHDRLVVPDVDNIRTHLIREAHDQISTAHPGRDKTHRLLQARYYWRGMRRHIMQYVRNCHACRRSSSPRDKTPGLLKPLPIPERPWQDISMDFCSFNADKHGYDNVCVFIDRLSKQPISVPCHKTVTAEEMAQLFITHVYRYYGRPLTIVSDQGPQFIAKFWKEFCRILGVKLKLSTAYHPQTDGQTEIMNQYMEQRLRPFLTYYQDNWSEVLPLMDFAQLVLPQESIGMSPYEVLNGRAPHLSFDWDTPPPDNAGEKLNQEKAKLLAHRMDDAIKFAQDNMRKAQQRMVNSANAHRREVDFTVGDRVWLTTKHLSTQRPSKKLDYPTAGPFKILEQVGHSYRLELPESMKIHPIFSPDKLRKAAEDPLPGQVEEPPPPVNITGDLEYEVDEILTVKKRHGKLFYRVNWLNFDEDLEFYPASDLKYSPHKIRDFHLAYPLLEGPPRSLPLWLKAWEDGIDDYDNLDDDAAMTKKLRTAFFRRGG